MPSKRIVYTRFDGGVSVCAPSVTAIAYMTNGGGRWDGFLPGFLDRQIAAQAQDGVGERAARSFVMAMQYGGCTDAEAYVIMRDRFCAHLGTACELVDTSEISRDRWFRDAWHRSHNGGPIYISMPAARKIQIAKLRTFADSRKIELRLDRWRQRVRKAESPEELKSIWPKDLICKSHSAEST